MLRIMMLLANARSDVMFAHYAVRRNIIHAVNITAEGTITCPQGQTSFSVNAPLRASRYTVKVIFELLSAATGCYSPDIPRHSPGNRPFLFPTFLPVSNQDKAGFVRS